MNNKLFCFNDSVLLAISKLHRILRSLSSIYNFNNMPKLHEQSLQSRFTYKTYSRYVKKVGLKYFMPLRPNGIGKEVSMIHNT